MSARRAKQQRKERLQNLVDHQFGIAKADEVLVLAGYRHVPVTTMSMQDFNNARAVAIAKENIEAAPRPAFKISDMHGDRGVAILIKE